MSYITDALTAAGLAGIPIKTVGPAGSNYPTANYANFSAALQQAVTDQNSNGVNGVPAFAIKILPGTYTINTSVTLANRGAVILADPGTVLLQPAAGLTGDCIDVAEAFNPRYLFIAGLTFDPTNLSTQGVAVGASPFTYTHGTSGAVPATEEGWVFVTGGTVSQVVFTPSGGTAETYSGTAPGSNGIFMGINDTLAITYSVLPTLAYSPLHSYINVQASGFPGSEIGAPAVLQDIVCNPLQIAAGKACGVPLCMDGCEDGEMRRCIVNSWGYGSYQCVGGTGRIIGGKYAGVRISGLSAGVSHCTIGNLGMLFTGVSAAAPQVINLGPQLFFNGTNSVWPDIRITSANSTYIIDNGTYFQGGSTGQDSGVTYYVGGPGVSGATNFLRGASLQFSNFELGQIAAHPSFVQTTAGSKTAVYGTVLTPNNANLLSADIVAGGTSFFGTVVRSNGAATAYNASQLLSGQSQSQVLVDFDQTGFSTLQANFISQTPPATGRYRIGGSIKVTTAGSVSMSVTVTYKDSAGAAASAVCPMANESGALLANGLIIATGRYYWFLPPFHAGSGTAITASTTGTTATLYAIQADLEWLG